MNHTPLYGKYEKTLDGNNRLILPKEYSRRIDDHHLVLTKWFDLSLALFPEDNWRKYAEAVHNLGYYTEGIRAVRRQFFGNATHISCDSQGRFNIADDLRNYAKITKNVIMLGDGDKALLFSDKVYQALLTKDEEDLDEKYEQALANVSLVFGQENKSHLANG